MNDIKSPLYAEIMQSIIRKIEAGEYLENQAIPNERELAEIFGVSRITSKRALEELQRLGYIYRRRGSGSYVSPLEKMQNVSGPACQVLDSNASKIIALVIPVDASAAGMLDTIKGASEVLNSQGYFLTIHNTHENKGEEQETLEELINRNVAGIIFYPYSDKDNIEFLINLVMNNFPIVAIDRYIESVPLSYVVSDNFDGTYKAVEHLIKNGHRRIAYFTSASVGSATSVRSRYMGYCKALKDHGIVMDSSIVINDYKKYDETSFGSEYPDLISNIVKYLMNRGATAVQTLNDDNAIMLEKTCLNMGVRVPEDLCIAGFDNLDAAQHLEVPLTTVKQDFYAMGKLAAEILIKALKENQYTFTAKNIPVELVIRESTGKEIKHEGGTA